MLIKHTSRSTFLYRNISTFLFVFLCLGLYSCESPASNIEEKLQNKAEAGKDQVTYVGSYSILDPSSSRLEGEEINLLDWEQDKSNPDTINTFYQSALKPEIVGFTKEGLYKFILIIKCKSGNIYKDTVAITVKPRQLSLIEDVNLEIMIRGRLNYREGNLTEDKLLRVDSLSSAVYALHNKVKSIKGLEYCRNITFLLLGSQSFTDLKPLAGLTQLEFLDLDQNYTIEDISPLLNLTNLKYLCLFINPIKDISPLRYMSKLTELYLQDLPITDIEPLSRLVNLEILYLDGDRNSCFKNIEALRYLTKLKVLNIALRGVSDINPLENLTELKLLSVGYNNITDISPVMKMRKLIRLSFIDNKVEDITGLRNLESLDYLDAEKNQIKDISELQYMKNIHLIGLAYNKIEDLSPIVNNPNIADGSDLYVTGNPLNDRSINEYIPALEKRGVWVFNWK